MSRLFIAEKPKLGSAIANAIGVKKRGDGFIECQNGDIVTWQFGHLLELVDAKAYDEKYAKWDLANLPIIPSPFKREVKSDKGVKKQFNVIKRLVKQASEIVHAGDPDREGQLLVDTTLEQIGNTKPVKRLLLASTDIKSAKKALANIRDNREFQNLKEAADLRSKSDWLVGINLTIASTLTAQAQGKTGVISVGRVQTPTLGLIVQRELAIKNFKPVDYFSCTAQLNSQEPFSVKFLPENNDNLGGDNEKRLIDKAVAEQAIEAIQRSATIKDIEQTNGTEQHPLAYTLSELQNDASKKLSFGVKQTAKVLQSLYENGFTSYPRTDCGYLPEEQFNDAKDILMHLGGRFEFVAPCVPSIKSKTWNTSKVGAHHGIIPTSKKPEADSLNSDEWKLYELIVTKFAAQFYPVAEFSKTRLLVADANNVIWVASGKTYQEKGWRSLYSNIDDTVLPNLTQGQNLDFIDSELKAQQTKPPTRFTEGSLAKAMSSIHNFVEEPELKKRLKENSGIGTEATRASIIETLLNRKFIETKGKFLQPTPLGINLIQSLPNNLTNAGLTAVWEDALKQVENGQLKPELFMKEITDRLLTRSLDKIKEIQF